MKNQFKLYIFSIVLIFNSITNGQTPIMFECHQHVINEQGKNALLSGTTCSYNDIHTNEAANDAYIPTPSSPIYTVRLNLHSMQEDDGSGNFQNNAEDIAFLHQLINRVNEFYSDNQPPIWNGQQSDPYIVDSRIRFRIDGIYFHQDSENCHKKPYNESTSSDVYFNQYGVNIEHSINVFFTELLDSEGNPYVHIAGNGFGLNGENRNCLGLYSYFHHYSNNTGAFNIMAFTFAHELGHALGLKHTYQPDELSDTYYPDIGGWCSCYTDGNCSNNMMGGANWREHFSPRQIGKMRRLMTIGWRAKIVDNCMLNESEKIINTNQIWNRPQLFSSDIKIVDGANVTAQCKLYLPQNKKIIVDLNSKLILDGSSVLNVCIEGVFIQVNEGGYLEIKDVVNLENCKINVLNGGTLKLSESVNLNTQSTISLFSGSYFCFTDLSSLNLIDSNTSLVLNEGINFGVNPVYFPGLSTGCLTSIDLLTHSGSGLIKDYSQDVYIQNETISSDRYIAGKNIYAGSHVTTSKPYGNVLINNGACVIFDCKEIVLDAGFECAAGASFEVKNY